jgi:hypothetical protein
VTAPGWAENTGETGGSDYTNAAPSSAAIEMPTREPIGQRIIAS